MSVQILIVIISSFFFLIIEALLNLSRRSKREAGTKQSDKGSLTAIWIIITVSFTLGFSYAEHGEWSIGNYIVGFLGLLFYITGIIIRFRAIKQLDSSFTVDVAFKEGQILRTEGMYKLVRHPSYLGGLMVITGIALGMNSIISFLIVIFPVFFAFNYRMNVEERLLAESFGNDYTSYKARTKKIIPFIF